MKHSLRKITFCVILNEVKNLIGSFATLRMTVYKSYIN